MQEQSQERLTRGDRGEAGTSYIGGGDFDCLVDSAELKLVLLYSPIGLDLKLANRAPKTAQS